MGLGPVALGGAVLHLFQHDGPIADDGVGVGLDPQVGGPHGEQLGGCDGRRGSCEDRQAEALVK